MGLSMVGVSGAPRLALGVRGWGLGLKILADRADIHLCLHQAHTGIRMLNPGITNPNKAGTQDAIQPRQVKMRLLCHP